MIRARRVAVTPKHRSLLDYLQLECLPGDDPCPYKDADVWFIAYAGTVPVGFAGIRPLPSDPSCWYLCRAGVIPAARGQGIQKRLIRRRLEAARKAGAAWVVTDTRASNCASSNSLIREGFTTYNPHTRWACVDSIYWRRKP
jgi:GNAT superfamily N-acetyltransferase